MPSGTLVLWETPAGIPRLPFREYPEEWTWAMKPHCQLGLLGAEQLCQEGFLVWSFFTMCRNAWLPPQGTAVIETAHPAQRSDCWRKHVGSNPAACRGIHVFRWAGDHKAQTQHQMFHPSHSSPSLSCDLLDVIISQKLQAQTLHPVVGFKGIYSAERRKP